jgi:hypothetical protein
LRGYWLFKGSKLYAITGSTFAANQHYIWLRFSTSGPIHGVKCLPFSAISIT